MEQGPGMAARRYASALLCLIGAAAGCGGEEGAANGCPPGMVASATGCQLAGAGFGGIAAGGAGGAAGSAGSTPAAGTTAMPNGSGTGGRGVAPTAGMNANPGTAGAAGTTRPPEAGASGAPAAGSGGASGPPPARSAGCGNATPPADGTKMIDVGGTQREFIVEIPDGYDANKAYKLIFAWHGLGGTGASIASFAAASTA